MSHVEKAIGTISDDPKLLDCIETALAKTFPKAHLNRDAKTWRWYGTWVNDYDKESAAYKQGYDPKEYGKCEHSISLDGCGYDIGIVKSKQGKGYTLLFDFYGTGANLRREFGTGCEKLTDAINVEVMKAKARRAGYEFTTKKLDNGAVVMSVNQNVGGF